MPLIDMLRASSPFHAAFMVRGSKSDDEDRCIFSGVLTEALSGAHDAAFEAPDKPYITNYSLAGFLDREVPLRASQYQVVLRPDIATGFRSPNNIYLESRPATPPAPVPWPPPGLVGAMSAAPGGSATRRGWSTVGEENGTTTAADFTRTFTRTFTKGPATPLKPLLERDADSLELKRRRQENEVQRYLRELCLGRQSSDAFRDRVRLQHRGIGSGASDAGTFRHRGGRRGPVLVARATRRGPGN